MHRQTYSSVTAKQRVFLCMSVISLTSHALCKLTLYLLMNLILMNFSLVIEVKRGS